MTLAVESNASMNGSDLTVTGPPGAQGHPSEPALCFLHWGAHGVTYKAVSSQKKQDPLSPCTSQQRSLWVAVSGPGFMMEGKEGKEGIGVWGGLAVLGWRSS